jgi:hypothetical protein
MFTKLKDFSVVIIGGGPSGAAAANACKRQGILPKNITVLEKNQRVGGKLKTDLTTGVDIGGIILSIGNPVVKYLAEHQIPMENVLPIEQSSLNQILYNTTTPSYFDTLYYNVKFAASAIYFANYYLNYLTTSPQVLKNTGDLSIKDYTQMNNLQAIDNQFEPWVEGMGYGHDNSYYRVMNYLRYLVPSAPIVNAFPGQFVIRVHGGYQQVIEKMLQGFNLHTSVKVQSIHRDEHGVNLQWKSNGQNHSTKANLLILATPPQAWNKLGMQLTDLEQSALNNLKFYRYPIAVCAIEGMPANQVFVPEALKVQGFGHVAFISTNDVRVNPEGGRIATVFMNLPSGFNDFSLDEGSVGRQTLLDDLHQLGYGKVTVINTKVWKDYNTTMPLSIGLELEANQGNLNTLYATTAMPSSFENVSNAIGYAEKLVARYFLEKFPNQAVAREETSMVKNLYTFYSLPRVNPGPVFAKEKEAVKLGL